MEMSSLGKKVFFLHPPPVLTEVIEQLAKQEFEIYLTSDHQKLRHFLASSPDSIVFADIDEGLDDSAWEAYLRELRKEVPAVGLGVVTLNDDSVLRERYLMDIQAQCGFVVLKIGAAKTAEIIAKTLEANEARGRRKFVRAACSPGTAKCAVEYEGMTIRADLCDLSSAGMAMAVEGGISLKVGTVLRDMSLTIKGQRVLASGVVVARRDGTEAERGTAGVYVVMFDPSSIDEARREKLKIQVFKINQAAMEAALDRA
jgi:Predicted glycosyltransferase